MTARNYVYLLCAISAVSCTSFPKGKLALDFTNETIPVMLNEAPAPSMTTVSALSEHYYESTWIMHSGGSDNTTSVNHSAGLVSPTLDRQMQAVIQKDPRWIAVTQILLDDKQSMLVGVREVYDYRLSLNLKY
jgi:hypothetical protein